MSEKHPPCFGQHWSASEAECRGGADPSYTHPTNGGNLRDPCRWYGQCAAQTNLNKTAPRATPQSAVIPPQSLLQHHRPPAPPAPPRPLQSPPQPAAMQPSAQYLQQVHVPFQAMHPSAQGGAYASPMYAAQPQAVPVNQPMVGAETQSFLMVPEPLDPHTSHAKRMSRTVFRSMFKAGALAVANYLDYYPVGQYPEG